MQLDEVYSQAREKMKGYCRVCKVCDGKACAGEVPGMGGTDTGLAFQANIEAWKNYKVKLRTLHEANDPSTEVEVLGQQLSTPIITAPVTGASLNMSDGALTEREYAEIVTKASKDYGTLAMTGDSGDPDFYTAGLEAIDKLAGCGIPVIKPREQEEIMDRVKEAEAVDALGIGVDVDGAGLITMALKGQPVGPKSFAEVKELVASTELPFILKGIMTPQEAVMAADAGIEAIVVSNHGGRVLDHTPGTATVLPEIIEAVGERMTVLVDGGIRFGVDILKALALGADAVLVGRPLSIGAFGGQEEGVKLILDKMTSELKKAMILTGCNEIDEVNQSILD